MREKFGAVHRKDCWSPGNFRQVLKAFQKLPAGFEECLRQVIFWVTRSENRLDKCAVTEQAGMVQEGPKREYFWSAENPSSTPGIRS